MGKQLVPSRADRTGVLAMVALVLIMLCTLTAVYAYRLGKTVKAQSETIALLEKRLSVVEKDNAVISRVQSNIIQEVEEG